MRFGIIPSEGGELYPEALEQAVLAETLGFDAVWLEEHHSVRGHYWPSPMMVLAAIAGRTERITLGTDVAISPFYHPVRLAEDAAILQGISRGRFILGLAVGYRPEEFALYGADLNGRGERLDEVLALLRGLWAGEEIDHESVNYRVRGHIEPLPSPPPQIWLGGWNPKAIRRAAQAADAWLPGPTATLEKVVAARATFDVELVRLGRDPAASPRPLTRDTVIARTDDEAWRLAEDHLLVNYRDEYGGGWSHPLIGGADATPTDRISALADQRFIIGSPATCVRAIEAIVASYQPDELILRLHFPGMDHATVVTALQLLAADVIPAFR